MKKTADTAADIHPLLAERWSPCSFDDGFMLSERQTASLCEAARWAPSSYGAQPWAFVLCPRNDGNSWKKALACLVEANQAWAKNTSLLILTCAKKTFTHNQKPNRHHAYDTGAAALSLVLQAEAMGLRSHQMGGFDPDRARKAFSVPDDYECMSFIAVGKQVPADNQNPEIAQRDRAPRERLALEKNFFHGHWGKNEGG